MTRIFAYLVAISIATLVSGTEVVADPILGSKLFTLVLSSVIYLLSFVASVLSAILIFVASALIVVIVIAVMGVKTERSDIPDWATSGGAFIIIFIGCILHGTVLGFAVESFDLYWVPTFSRSLLFGVDVLYIGLFFLLSRGGD